MLQKNRQNLRLHERYDCHQPIDLYYKQTSKGKCLIKNISQEGLMLQVPNNTIQKGSIIELVIFSFYEKRPIKLPAFVVHSQANAIGVWFNDSNLALQRYIDCMIENRIPSYHSATPLLNR